MTQMSISFKHKKTYRYIKQTCVCQRGEGMQEESIRYLWLVGIRDYIDDGWMKEETTRVSETEEGDH